jgi:hypothetical protein
MHYTSRFWLSRESWDASPLLIGWEFGTSEVLVQIEYDLEGVAAAQVWQRRFCLFETNTRLEARFRVRTSGQGERFGTSACLCILSKVKGTYFAAEARNQLV